jgi:hypothetical protein
MKVFGCRGHGNVPMWKSDPFWQYAFKLLPTKCGKLDNAKLQVAGPVGVIAAVACAECGAHALAYWLIVAALVCRS